MIQNDAISFTFSDVILHDTSFHIRALANVVGLVRHHPLHSLFNRFHKIIFVLQSSIHTWKPMSWREHKAYKASSCTKYATVVSSGGLMNLQHQSGPQSLYLIHPKHHTTSQGWHRAEHLGLAGFVERHLSPSWEVLPCFRVISLPNTRNVISPYNTVWFQNGGATGTD